MDHNLKNFEIVVSKSAAKQFRKIPKKIQPRIYKSLENLKNNPYIGIPLKGELTGKFSLRVWPYRIIYRVLEKKLLIEVIDIGHRQGVYR